MVMPRPGQPGAMQFDGTNITEFLEEWNIECEDFGLTNTQRCARFPNYCTLAIKEVVKLLPGYVTTNWDTLQSDLKNLYWQHDKPKNTYEALIKLVQEAPTMDLNVYILKFTAITDTLVEKHALSTLDRIGRLLDGLSGDLRKRVLKFCTKNSWRLSTQDTGAREPNFTELKEFVLTEAKLAQKQTVYEKERAIRGGQDETPHLKDSIAAVIRTGSTPVPASAMKTTPASASKTIPVAPDPIDELTKQLSNLTLLLKATMQEKPGPAQASVTVGTLPPQTFNRVPRCIFCDSTDHTKQQCSDLSTAIRKGLIRMNDQNRIVNAVTGEEIPTMFGRGGMKKTLEENQTPAPPMTVNNANITLDRFGSIGNEGSVRVTYLDFDNDTRTDEIIDADVYEKRRRDEYETRRRVRPRNDESPTPFPPSDRTIPTEGPPAQSQRNPTNPTTNTLPGGEPTPTTNPPPNATTQNKKFRLASELSGIVTAAQVGEQMMDTPMQFSMRQIMAVAPEVTGYLHDQTRKRRIPIEATTTATSKITTENVPSSNVNSTEARTFYACPSGHAKATIDQQITVHALVDNGSGVNMMPRHVLERL